jgi:hypothetical protein
MNNSEIKITSPIIDNSIFGINQTKKYLNEKTQRPFASNCIFSKRLENLSDNFLKYETQKENKISNFLTSDTDFQDNLKEDDNVFQRNQKNLFKVNRTKKENEIQNELNNIFYNNNDEELNNEIHYRKNIIPQIFNSEIKLSLQEDFDNLCFLITDLTKISYKNCTDEKLDNKESILEINKKISEILCLLEKLNNALKDYNDKINSLGQIFDQIEQYYNDANYYFLIRKLQLLRKIYLNESKIYKSNYLIFEKIKKSIPFMCNKLLLNLENKKKLIEIENRLNVLHDDILNI